MKIPLFHLAHTRSAALEDPSGSAVNLAVIAWKEEDYAVLVRELTPERVSHFLGSLVAGPVERYELPNVYALNFVLAGARKAGFANTLAAALLRLEIEV